MRIPIRLVESDAPNPPESTAQTICDLINEIPEHAIKARIELPAEDLHALALDWHAKNTLLQEIADGVQQSQGKQNDLLAKIKRVTKGGAA
jgi:radical SAM superfamily enzyme